jgi:hypothetical protein
VLEAKGERSMTDESRYQMVGFWTVALYILAVLSLSNCLQTLFGWFHSQDVKGWWPIGMLLYSLFAFAYAVAFSATTRVTCRADIGFAAVYNLALALLLFLHGYLYYTIKIDWLAVNSRAATLTGFQNLVRSDITPIAIYVTFLLGAVVAGRIRRIRHEP